MPKQLVAILCPDNKGRIYFSKLAYYNRSHYFLEHIFSISDNFAKIRPKLHLNGPQRKKWPEALRSKASVFNARRLGSHIKVKNLLKNF